MNGTTSRLPVIDAIRNDRNALSAIAHEGQTLKTKGTGLRGLQKVNDEMVLIMTVYNVKRLLNILALEDLLQKLATWKPEYPKSTDFCQNRGIARLFEAFKFYRGAMAA